MSFLVQSTAPLIPKDKKVYYASIALAAVFVILAVAQLYSYEDFPDVIASFWLPGGRTFAALFAALLVVSEVLAIPFLLFMRLSPAMRVFSMVAGWVAIISWLITAVSIGVSDNAITNGGILGATVPIAPGWGTIILIAGLGALSGWISWKMWPLRKRV